MDRLDLNGQWRMRRTDQAEWIEAQVPGSVGHDLLRAGGISDPFYRANEDQVFAAFTHDYEYEREFTVSSSLLAHDRVLLCCEGLDTLADVYVNETHVASTANMHRCYEFDVKDRLKEGRNTIRIVFSSPVEYVRRKHEERPLWGAPDAVAGFPHLRKAHCMFGWDWGPKIPDMGIWRDIFLVGYSWGRLADVYVVQNHRGDGVGVEVKIRHDQWRDADLVAAATLAAPDGTSQVLKVYLEDDENALSFTVTDPQLWWPNGYGDQPLYKLQISLLRGEELLDSRKLRIGLRTLKVRREKDEWGESFAFEVNGVPIFAMGADYIPEDNLLARCSRERTEKLIQDCVAANFNCLRVWGGGIYPPDYFYDLCDEYGLIVWQGFMFACAVYELTEEFADDVREEIRDNVRRIRHHPCLGLWCGNNEIEWGWGMWEFPKEPRLRADYIKLFEVLIPSVLKEADPGTFYWPSSPSSGGSFDAPNDPDRGNVHYWEVWHGQKPFTDYRSYHFRFVSEFGFQSFPALKTVRAFTEPEDRNIFSYVMEKHQKNGLGNGKILYYLAETFRYPKDFSSLLYASQLLQAEAIKYGVEHWRRNRGRCMGAIYWQLNDCWPVASWSSIDYYHRWKALHYFARRFYAPILVSAEEGETGASLYVTNETFKEVNGTLVWKLRDNHSRTICEGSEQITVSALSARKCADLDFSDVLTTVEKRQSTYLEFAFITEGKTVSGGTALFVAPKHFRFIDPSLDCEVTDAGDRFIINVKSRAFARYVELDLVDLDARFSDNYFDLSAGSPKQVELRKELLSRQVDLTELRARLVTRSLYDTWEKFGRESGNHGHLSCTRESNH